MSLRVSTCCGDEVKTDYLVIDASRKIVQELHICSSCHEPNDGESIAERDMRIAETVRKACAEAADEFIFDERVGRRSEFAPDAAAAVRDIGKSIRALDLGAITGRKM